MATHTDTLIDSRPDDVLLPIAVEDRFLELCGLYTRVTGEMLIPPVDLQYDFLLFRTMRVRHRQGDYRHRDSELRATQAIAQWTLDVKKELCGQVAERLEFY